jgi:peroxiredoxin
LRGEIGTRTDVSVAVVTMGKPAEAAEFCRRRLLPFRCLSDPARAAYRAYGLRRGSTNEIMGPATVLAGFRAAARGHLPSVPVQDVYQLGGVFLIDTDGTVRYAHHPRHAGDNPRAGALRRAVEQAVRLTG